MTTGYTLAFAPKSLPHSSQEFITPPSILVQNRRRS
jgi:hypothetical protein